MVLVELAKQVHVGANECSFFLGIVVTALFFRQYKKYQEEIEKQEEIDKFLA